MLNNRKSQKGGEQQARDRRLHLLSLVEVSFFVRVVLLVPSFEDLNRAPRKSCFPVRYSQRLSYTSVA